MNNELYHYGVKGMKWGVRHDPEREGIRNAKKAYKKANRQYSKDYDRAYKYSSRHPISQHIKKSPTYAESNKRWEKAYDSAVASNKAKDNLKAEKKKYKELKAEKKGSRKEGLKRVDPSLAKNATTRRVANDYHNLSNTQFAGKYKTTKKKFAKRYVKSDGDTFSMGLKKQAIAMKILGANNSSIMNATTRSIAAEHATNNGHKVVGEIMRFENDEYIKRNINRR